MLDELNFLDLHGASFVIVGTCLVSGGAAGVADEVEELHVDGSGNVLVDVVKRVEILFEVSD